MTCRGNPFPRRLAVIDYPRRGGSETRATRSTRARHRARPSQGRRHRPCAGVLLRGARASSSGSEWATRRPSSPPAAITTTSGSTPGSRGAARRRRRGPPGLFHFAIRYPTTASAGRGAEPGPRRRDPARRRLRPRRQRGALPPRSRPERDRALLGPPRGRVAARPADGPPGVAMFTRPARPRRPARRARPLSAGQARGRASRAPGRLTEVLRQRRRSEELGCKARIGSDAAVAQLARASACHAEGRGFESHQPL